MWRYPFLVSLTLLARTDEKHRQLRASVDACRTVLHLADDNRLGHAGCGVVVVAAVRIAEVVAEQRLVPFKAAVDGIE
jgi:hypothetical protein